ncbi:hypothetical protein KI387_030364, partial [Taxus chinensis]
LVTTFPIPPSHLIPYSNIDTYDIGQSSTSHPSSTTPSTLSISTHTIVIISPIVSDPISNVDPLTEAPITPASSATPNKILDTAIQHDNVSTDDSDDKFDFVELTDDKLYNLNFTPIQ